MPARHEQLSALIAARLERVRGDLTNEEFARLVADVTRTTLRFEEIDARERATPLPGSLVAPRNGHDSRAL